MSEALEKAKALLATLAGMKMTVQAETAHHFHGIVVEFADQRGFMEADNRIPIETLLAIAAAPTIIATLIADADALQRERDAYKRAKSENDERFMIERDEARAERDALRTKVQQLEESADIVNNIFQFGD